MSKKRARVIGTYAGPLEETKMGKRIGIQRLRSEGCFPMEMTSRQMVAYRQEKLRGT